ncbi:MAG TPA: 16S rRNA (adenine(1518)-N(6)/adenine(1519)-N(6))-dimethyltransferase RsmA [Bacteroidales bacterium]|nr:16S rRNA (adenine(1518)-N(6)/adenine(1519)-N(6))-dimethyltransferase RsmA [Bacteroidales bacterium]
MSKVRPKKNLGQHFLKDEGIAGRIASSLTGEGYDSVLEVGPGMGILTAYLVKRSFADFRVVEIDPESIDYLKTRFPDFSGIMEADFLNLDLDSVFTSSMAVIGNFPYNISSQIFFRILKYRDLVTEVCGMLQKEVAERICAGPGSRTYGILSVFLQAYYSTEYLFTVSENVFVPVPRVKSGVIRLRRNSVNKLACDEKLFVRVVKSCFNQRRKTLRNSVRAAFRLTNEDYPDFGLRPEQLSVQGFIDLTNWIEDNSLPSLK